MTKSRNKTASILQEVAAHELCLREQTAKADREADAILAQARAEAESIAADAERHIREELRRLRRKAADSRQKTHRDIIKAAQDEVHAARARHALRGQDVLNEVLSLILPHPLGPRP